MPNQTRAILRRNISFSFLVIFVLYVLLSYAPLEEYFSQSKINKRIDFSRYIHSRTLSLSSQRIIIVGDIHGQYDSFQDLLSTLDYDSSSSKDVIIHTGDILAKGTISDCLRVLDWMTSRSIIGVRGNHDQKVIDWKGLNTRGKNITVTWWKMKARKWMSITGSISKGRERGKPTRSGGRKSQRDGKCSANIILSLRSYLIHFCCRIRFQIDIL